jgi:hypothetical protein
MINLQKAKVAFKNYVANYDPSEDLIRLKIVHTYAVMDKSEALCQMMHKSQEETELAMLIGLLHDIGRFEQFVRYGSFVDYETVDHAQLGSDILFKDGLIRSFIEEDKYDAIIKNAIEQHNKFRVKKGFDDETMFYINMIRDTDKLDNFRVKETEKVETLMRCDMQTLENESITPKVYNDFKNHKLIFGPDRTTHLDMWISLVAFIFDMNFKASLQYVKEHDYINASFDRVHPKRPEVKAQYEELRQVALDFIA